MPQGWTLDLTENACCELRRWDKARMHRKRGCNAEERQQKRLEQLRATWQELGFASMPPCCRGLLKNAPSGARFCKRLVSRTVVEIL